VGWAAEHGESWIPACAGMTAGFSSGGKTEKRLTPTAVIPHPLSVTPAKAGVQLCIRALHEEGNGHIKMVRNSIKGD
jgi:hypothetical protein